MCNVCCSYENIKCLLDARGTPNIPAAHWSNDSGWQIAESMNAILLTDLKERVSTAKFLTVTVDESSAIDLSENLSIELQFVEQGVRVSKFLVLKKITNQTAAALTLEITEALDKLLGMPKEMLPRTCGVWL